MTTATPLDPRVSEFATQQEADDHARWLRARVQEALDDPRPPVAHEEVMVRLDATLAQLKARATSPNT